MARPREFDEATVLDAAMRRFWALGYERTSVRDLAEQMGMTGASLYNAFGDKQSLYERSLEFYLEQSVRDRIARLEASLSPLAAIRAFFDEIVERSVTDSECRGCMLVNAALEVAPHDVALRAVVARELEQIEAFFRRCCVAGQQQATVTTGQPPDAVAKMLLSVLLGIRVLARTRPQRAVLQGAATAVLGLLTAAP
jgi:TetR/AcrR family transcriptional repressor of nem operon